MVVQRRAAGFRPRRAAAVGAGKLAAAASRALRRGGGTALPGSIATRFHPSLVAELADQLALGSIIVSGTNGKTTTSRILATILSDQGLSPVRNEAGSNLLRGIGSALLAEAALSGNLRHAASRIGLFEVDEAALPDLSGSLAPRALLLLDLFRDQLDRYGEVATVARVWAMALARLRPDVGLVVNGDDPLLANTALGSPLRPSFFGIESAERQALTTEHASDVKACPRCGGQVSYTAVYLGHLGHYCCRSCGFGRPDPDVSASDVRLRGFQGSAFTLRHGAETVAVEFPLPGMYNVYNALAAAAMAVWLGVGISDCATSLRRVTPAFGRMERLDVDGRQVYLALAKNPAGLNEVVRTATQDPDPLHLYVLLNDNTADGHDVSWIWDADVEMLEGRVASVVFGGTRAADMALRFKYAGITGTSGLPAWELALSTEAGLRRAVELTPASGRLLVVPTYTALLDVRGTLARLGCVRPYWET